MAPGIASGQPYGQAMTTPTKSAELEHPILTLGGQQIILNFGSALGEPTDPGLNLSQGQDQAALVMDTIVS